jgi:glycosyltransferase involved in cell wall biosynthesis
VLAIANELFARGYSPAICVPDDPRTIDDVGRPPFPVLGFAEAEQGAIPFPDGRGPDLVHAFTPREHVRKITMAAVSRYGCPYVVHLEDNEEAILADAIGSEAYERIGALPLAESDAIVGPRRAHPVRAAGFLEGAAGVTAVIDTLLELKPASVPGAVFWPGFDKAVLALPENTPSLRKEFRIAADDFVLVYTGNIHDSNLDEVRSLYLAVGALRDAGHPVTLLKTGWNQVDMKWVKKAGLRKAVRDLGFVRRERVWRVLAAADALVQPGRSGAFNDYRFPSKLPDFLASGRPVILPASNIGRYLRHDVDALLLERGDADEIVDAVQRLIADPKLGERLGANGRDFALEKLRWSENVEPIVTLYDGVAGSVSS